MNETTAPRTTMRHAHRPWRGALVAVLLLLGVAGYAAWTFVPMVERGVTQLLTGLVVAAGSFVATPCQMALDAVDHHPAIVASLGRPLEITQVDDVATRQDNGNELWTIDFTVSGPDGVAEVRIDARLADGPTWTLDRLDITPHGGDPDLHVTRQLIESDLP